MTPEKIEDLVKHVDGLESLGLSRETAAELRGALDLAKSAIPSGQVAEDEATLEQAVAEYPWNFRGEVRAALSRLAAQAQSAETYREMWRESERGRVALLAERGDLARRLKDEESEAALNGIAQFNLSGQVAEDERVLGDALRTYSGQLLDGLMVRLNRLASGATRNTGGHAGTNEQVVADVSLVTLAINAAEAWWRKDLPTHRAALSRLVAKAQGYEAAVADSAALVERVRVLTELLERIALEVVEDPHRYARKALEELPELTTPHPGAALLEQHRKALEAIADVLCAARAYDNKPHHLYSSVRRLAGAFGKTEDERTQAERQMDVAYTHHDEYRKEVAALTKDRDDWAEMAEEEERRRHRVEDTHRRALARARNEGLEKAAAIVESTCDMDEDCSCDEHVLAAKIRAVIEKGE